MRNHRRDRGSWRTATVMVLSLGLVALGMRMSPDTSGPTFTGYHWSAHASTTYQMRWKIREVDPSVDNTTVVSTIAWDPRVTIQTGAMTSMGTAVTLNIAGASETTSTASGTAPPPTVIGAMSVRATLTPDGAWQRVRWSIPTTAVLPRSILTAMLPLQNLLPLVPSGGWTAGHSRIVSYLASDLEIPEFHVVMKQPASLTERMIPSVGNHHWTVRTMLNLPSDLRVFLLGPVTSSHPNGRYSATMSAHLVTVDNLAGNDGGELQQVVETAQGQLTTANTPSQFTATWSLTAIRS